MRKLRITAAAVALATAALTGCGSNNGNGPAETTNDVTPNPGGICPSTSASATPAGSSQPTQNVGQGGYTTPRPLHCPSSSP